MCVICKASRVYEDPSNFTISLWFESNICPNVVLSKDLSEDSVFESSKIDSGKMLCATLF